MPVVIFILFFSIGLALREGALMDPDTAWHLAAGDLIRKLGHLPASDPWSYTAGDQPWYNISWGYDVVLSKLHEIGGLPALVVASIGLYALAVSLTGWVALKSSKSVIASLFVTALSGFVLLPGMLARPQGLTFLFVIGFYALLRFGRARLPYLLPLLMIFWANIHGGFLAGFVIGAAFFAEALAARDFARCRRLVILGALCGLALLVNPYGWRLVDAAQLTMTSAMKEVLSEWRPAAIGGANAVTFFVAAFFLVSALYERRIPLADKLLACFWLAAGLASARMMQIAALLSAPYLAQALALRLRQSPIGSAIEKRDAAYGGDLARPAVRTALLVLAFGLVVAAFAPPVQKALAGKDKAFAAFPARTSPQAALDYLEADYPYLRIYNEYGMGGYLVLRGDGRTKVFFDGRADTAYPREVLKDGVAIGLMGAARRAGPEDMTAWRGLVAKYGVEGFLISDRMRLYDMLLRLPDWTKVYEDDDAALFVRKDLVQR